MTIFVDWDVKAQNKQTIIRVHINCVPAQENRPTNHEHICYEQTAVCGHTRMPIATPKTIKSLYTSPPKIFFQNKLSSFSPINHA